MSDRCYSYRKPCGCLQVAMMVDDTDPADLKRYADVIAKANRGEPCWSIGTAEEIRTTPARCPTHAFPAPPAGGKGGQ